jgi:hypothetical protein
MDYQVLIASLAFGFALQISAKYDASPKLAAFVAVGLPFIIATTVGIFRAIGFNYPILGNAISLLSITILLVQYFATLFIFEKLQYENSIGGFLLWGAGGFISVIILIPAIVTSILH